METKHLAILATHPIQYHSGWFRALAAQPNIDLEVLFCHKATPREQAEAGFGVEFDWDVSLLDGYRYRFLDNVATDPSISRFSGLDTPAIAQLINDAKFDAVIVNGWNYKSAWQAIRACWRTRTPVMARGDSHLRTRRDLLKRAVKRPLYSWFIPRLDACLPVGAWSRDYFLHYGADPDRLFFVPHAIEEEFFVAESERLLPQREDLRRVWRIPPASTVFLFAGKFIQKKRPMDFVRAIERAASHGANQSGLMVGDGPLRPQCDDYARTANAPIRFAGFLNRSEITKAYVAADALVMTSDGEETWGVVANEAMTCGRPGFVTDMVGCGPDLIRSKGTGEVFHLGQVEELASLLETYAGEPARLSEMGASAKRHLKLYSIASAVEGVIEAMSSVSNGKTN